MMNEFEVVDESITTEHLDSMVQGMAELEADYKSKKAVSDEAYHKYQEARAKCISTLQQAGKKKYHVDEIGTVSVTEKLKAQVPKTPESKQEFFKWLNTEMGAEGFLTYVGINYQTLQRLYNEQFEMAKERGDADTFTIPGVADPVTEYGLSFRK